MNITDWSDIIGEENYSAFHVQFAEGVRSIDLPEQVATFLTDTVVLLEFGISNAPEQLEAELIAVVNYIHGDGTSKELVDMHILGIDGVLVGSVSYVGTNENNELMQTYHLTKQIHPTETKPMGVVDVAYMFGVVFGDLYYMIEEKS